MRSQLLLLVFLDRSDRDSRPARYHFLDVFARHDACRSVVQLVAFPQHAEVFFLFALFFGIKTRLFEFGCAAIADSNPVRDEFHALLVLGNLFR